MHDVIIYGANGFVGREISRLAKENSLNVLLAGRNALEIEKLAKELELDHAIFSTDDTEKLDANMSDAKVIMNCAGPFMETFKAIIASCLRTKTHYLDITGEIPVFQTISALDDEAKKKGVMLLPGIGFDVAPTDCMSLYLKENFQDGDKLTLAFNSEGPAGIPPGTLKTMVSLIPYGNWARKNGELIQPGKGMKTRYFEFENIKKKASRISWGDVFTAYHSTKIPNIEVFAVFPKSIMIGMKLIEYLRPILKHPKILNFMKKNLKGGSTKAQQEKTKVWLYGELEDIEGKKVTCRMKGPEAGLVWTSLIALQGIKEVLSGNIKPGYQTPASAFGHSFIRKIEGVEMGEIEYVE